MRRDGESVSERGVSVPNELINREPGGEREREREREREEESKIFVHSYNLALIHTKILKIFFGLKKPTCICTHTVTYS